MRLLRVIPFVLLLFVARVDGAGAQGVTFGLWGGPTWATLEGADAENFRRRAGFSAGGFATLHASRLLAIQPEILYAEKGAEAEALEGVGSVRLTYVEVPLLARLTLPTPAAGVRPHLVAGPAISFRRDCEVDAEVGGEMGTLDCEDEIFGGELATKNIDYGVVLGGGIAFGVGRADLVLDARYDLGLPTIDNSSADQSVKNRVIYLLLGLAYRLER